MSSLAASRSRSWVHTLLAVMALLFSAAHDRASAQSHSSSSLSAEQRSAWGVLADMAGQDFVGDWYNRRGDKLYPSMYVFRWAVPGKRLQVWSTVNASFAWTLQLNDDGSIMVAESKGSNYHSDGTVKHEGSRTVLSSPHFSFREEYNLAKEQLTVSRHVDGVTMTGRLVPVSAAGPQQQQRLASFRARRQIAAPSDGPLSQLAQANNQSPIQSVIQAPSSVLSPPPEATNKPLSRPGTPTVPGQLGPRVALVIGNSAYAGNLGSLVNPARDADLLATSLRRVGFNVEVVKNADQKGMKRAIARLGERLTKAGPGVTGLFFFAGHGVQSRGTNYLIPVGAAVEREADVDLESVAADTVLLQMEEAGASTSIVILDACRNMPLTRSFRNSSRGLARMEAPNGSFIAYSTAPGSVAADGDGVNSPFALALAQEINEPSQPIEVVFRTVRKKVLNTTGGKQTPWDSSSLIEPFMFVP